MKIPKVFLYAGLGAALMYLFDPQMGNRRRALLRDQTYSLRHQAEELLDTRGEDLVNRARGVVNEAIRLLETADEVAGETLQARVKSSLGRAVVSNPSAIEVTADSGRVTLRGTVPADEIQRIVDTARAVSGVRSVENQMEAHQDSGSTPDPQGAKPKRTRAKTSP